MTGEYKIGGTAASSLSATDLAPRLQPGLWAAPAPRTTRFEQMRARNELREIQALSGDWDGYGALAIPSSTKLNAWHVLHTFEALPVAPDVYPDTSGTVSFEWRRDDARAHLQVGETSYSMYVERPSERTQFFQGLIGQLGHAEVDALLRMITPSTLTVASRNRITLPATSAGTTL